MRRILPPPRNIPAILFLLSLMAVTTSADTFKMKEASSPDLKAGTSFIMTALPVEANVSSLNFESLQSPGSSLWPADLQGPQRMSLRRMSLGMELNVNGPRGVATSFNKSLKTILSGSIVNAAIPEPTTLFLMGTGLAVLAAAFRRKGRAQKAKLAETNTNNGR